MSDRYDDPDGALAEDAEFLPGSESKKPRFTDVSATDKPVFTIHPIKHLTCIKYLQCQVYTGITQYMLDFLDL